MSLTHSLINYSILIHRLCNLKLKKKIIKNRTIVRILTTVCFFKKKNTVFLPALCAEVLSLCPPWYSHIRRSDAILEKIKPVKKEIALKSLYIS